MEKNVQPDQYKCCYRSDLSCTVVESAAAWLGLAVTAYKQTVHKHAHGIIHSLRPGK